MPARHRPLSLRPGTWQLTGATCVVAAVVATLVISAPGASGGTRTFRLGSALSVAKHRSRLSPTPTPTSSPTPSPSPSPIDTTTPSPADTSTPTPTDTSMPSPTDTSSSPTDSPSPSPTPTPDQACGGDVLKPDGSPWVCTFDDEFSGTSLDRTNWTVQTTAASGFHSGAECFVDDPNNVSVSDGTLDLTVRQEDAPFTCSSPTGSYTTQYTSGEVMSLNHFSQTYGRYEVRAKLPAATVQGLQETLWLWPVDQFKYGAWPGSGEIDFAEFYSKYAGWNIPFLHYNLSQSTVSWASNTNIYTALPGASAQPGMHCQISQQDFNTYTVVWQPGQIVLQVNGQNCIVDNYSATNVGSPAPFDQPFFLALTQALGIGNNAFIAGTTPLPATTRVDYVRVWQ